MDDLFSSLVAISTDFACTIGVPVSMFAVDSPTSYARIDNSFFCTCVISNYMMVNAVMHKKISVSHADSHYSSIVLKDPYCQLAQ